MKYSTLVLAALVIVKLAAGYDTEEWKIEEARRKQVFVEPQNKDIDPALLPININISYYN